jgi:hypothetical protein
MTSSPPFSNRGFARDFFFRAGEHYTGSRIFMPKGQECKVSLHIFQQMLAEVSSSVTIYSGISGLAVTTASQKVITVSVNHPSNSNSTTTAPAPATTMITFRPKVAIDASYEGDLLRLSGASYTVGREANTTYNEPHAGILPWPFPGSDPGQIFPPAENYTVNPFADSSNSTLLPLVNGVGFGGAPHTADKKIMSYNFRVCLTNNVTNMVPLPKPAGYDPADFELLARYLAIDPKQHALYIQKCHPAQRQPGCGMFIWGKLHLPNTDGGKIDLNTLGPISTNNIGRSWEWPLANESYRAQLFEEHKYYDQGLLYFLSTEPSVPESMRSEMASYGLCKDEFVDSDHWPPQLYVRESIRMVNAFVLREGPTGAALSVDKGVAPDNSSVGIGNWGIDVHQVQRVAVRDYRDGHWRTVDEGDLEVHAGGFEVPYGSIVPRKSEVQNLIVPVCIATSHLAYGAYRLESPYMVVGHSAGVAAAMAVASNAAVQDVSVPALQKVLREQGQILTLAERKPFPTPPGPAPPPEPVPLAVGPCADAAASTMTVKSATVKSSIVKLLLNARSECASAYGYSTADGARIVSAECHTSNTAPGKENQEWFVVPANGSVVETQICLAEDNVPNKCSKSCLIRSSSKVTLGECDASESAALWDVQPHCLPTPNAPGCIREAGPGAAKDSCLLGPAADKWSKTVAVQHHPPIAMGVNGHPFTQPNYMQGSLFVSDGVSAGISHEAQLDEMAALGPAGKGDGGAAPFYYRLDTPCAHILGLDDGNMTRAAQTQHAVQKFVQSAQAKNLAIVPILFPHIQPNTSYIDDAAVAADAESSTLACARIFTELQVRVFEIGQEWDNLALLPGRGGAKQDDYNMTVYNHLLAELTGMAAGVRKAAALTTADGAQVQIGVNTGGWIHFKFLQMLVADQLDFDIVAYHWYSDMGDMNNAGGYDVWNELVGLGKDIWITELDRRGGSSLLPVNHDALDQTDYLNHEIALLVNLSAASAPSYPLKAIFTYELFDEPQQGNSYPKTCTTGNISVNGESCYGLLSASWNAGPECDQYPSCNFTTSSASRKPAWSVVQHWANILGKA